jgi:hypothetical protein
MGKPSADPPPLAGIVPYAFLNARRERLGQIPEPADNPPDNTAAPVPRTRNGSQRRVKERCDDGRCSVPGG